MGPLFAWIIKRQFENLRDGDRLFFSHVEVDDAASPTDSTWLPSGISEAGGWGQFSLTSEHRANCSPVHPVPSLHRKSGVQNSGLKDESPVGLQEVRTRQWHSQSRQHFRGSNSTARHLSSILPLVSQSREGLWVPEVRHTIYSMESLGRF